MSIWSLRGINAVAGLLFYRQGMGDNAQPARYARAGEATLGNRGLVIPGQNSRLHTINDGILAMRRLTRNE